MPGANYRYCQSVLMGLKRCKLSVLQIVKMMIMMGLRHFGNLNNVIKMFPQTYPYLMQGRKEYPMIKTSEQQNKYKHQRSAFLSHLLVQWRGTFSCGVDFFFFFFCYCRVQREMRQYHISDGQKVKMTVKVNQWRYTADVVDCMCACILISLKRHI